MKKHLISQVEVRMVKIIGLSLLAVGMWVIGYLMGKYER